MLTIVIIIVLYVLLSGLIYWMLRKKTVRLSFPQIAFFFGLKIAAGSAYGYIYGKFYNGDDTWGLNHDAWIQYQRLLHTPGLFFKSLFTLQPLRDPALYFGDFKTVLEYWEFGLVTRMMAPFNCISQGNYYINVVFFSFLSFWGAYLLYKLLTEQFDKHDRSYVRVSLFLFVPAVFWLSGIRAEGLILLSCGLLLYYFSRWLVRPRIGNTLLCLAAFAFLFILRDSFALSLLPALLAWWLSARFHVRSPKAFGWVYGLLIILFVAASFLPPPYNPLRYIVQKQQAFLSLQGNTRFNLTPLEYNIPSFLLIAPEAFINTLLRPWPWEAKGALQWLVALENIIVWISIAVVCTRYGARLKNLFLHPLAWALLCLALSNYLEIGYVVPFPGAIVRYRVLPELFLLCLLGLAWKKTSSTRSLTPGG